MSSYVFVECFSSKNPNLPTDYNFRPVQELITDNGVEIIYLVSKESNIYRLILEKGQEYKHLIYEEPTNFYIDPKELECKSIDTQEGRDQRVAYETFYAQVTHIPSGIFAICGEEVGQLRNKEMAERIVKAKLYKKKIEEVKWKNYLLSIGVKNLNNEEEIDEKLDEIENNDPKFQAHLKEIIEEFHNTPESELIKFSSAKEFFDELSKEEVKSWLEELLEENEKNTR